MFEKNDIELLKSVSERGLTNFYLMILEMNETIDCEFNVYKLLDHADKYEELMKYKCKIEFEDRLKEFKKLIK